MSLVLTGHNPYKARLCGIDPGTTTLGLCFLDYDVRDYSIISIVAETFNATRYMDDDDIIALNHHVRFMRLMAQKNNFMCLLQRYHPLVVCSESPFYNRLRPTAYGPLMETMTMLHTTVMEYDLRVPFYAYAPAVVKRSVGAFATSSNKLDTKAAVLSKAEVLSTYNGNIALLDEHSIDAIAVALTHLNLIRG